MVLSSIKPGNEVTILDINGGRGIRSRLYSMGLVPGTKLKVLNGNTAGPIMIVVRDSRLALGQGMAQKIIVR